MLSINKKINKSILVLATACLSSLTVATELDDNYFTEAQKINTKDFFASPTLQVPEYMGYQSSERISRAEKDSEGNLPDDSRYYRTVNDERQLYRKSLRELMMETGRNSREGKSGIDNGYGMENQVDAALRDLYEKSATEYEKSTKTGVSASTDDLIQRYKIEQQNYLKSKELSDKSIAWEKARLAEIKKAREVRSANGVFCPEQSEYNGNKFQRLACQNRDVQQNELYEAINVDDRIKIKNYWAQFNNQAEGTLSQQDKMVSEFTDSNGNVDVAGIISKYGGAMYMATKVPTTFFCLMDLSAAVTQPECKKPVCEVLGKWTCKALGF